MTEVPSEAPSQPVATGNSPSADASHEPQKEDASNLQIESLSTLLPEAPRQEDSLHATEPRHSSPEPNPGQDAPTKQDWVPLSEATISFAIDTSGSTFGRALEQEQQAIRTVSTLLNDTAKDASRILPWSSHAGHVTPLSGLSNLSSYGGTDPEVLLKDSSCLAALRNSNCWFLLTDGEIPELSKQRFAKALSSKQLHGTTCVVIIFGKLRGQPTTCNISVGVSVFAAAPDCLFLFKDTESDICYLLQCKGTFTEILEQHNYQQPLLNDDTTWKDLPQIALKELSCVRIQDHRNLQADEVYFDSDLIVNLADLLAGRIIDKKIIDALLGNPAHMRTITMTAQTRGMAEELRQWVIKQELDPSDLLALDVPKVEEKAVTSMTSLMQRMNTQYSLPYNDQAISRLQAELRASHTAYSSALNTKWAAAEDKSYHRQASVSSVLDRSRSDSSVAGNLSTIGMPTAQHIRPSITVSSSTQMTISENLANTYNGVCPLCAQENVPMALLLREPPWTQVTQDFPAVGSKSRLAFPLAMGNFRETDIICTALYCDDCANTLMQTGGKLGEDKVTCSLTLVLYSSNKRAYDRLLGKAFQHRFDEDGAPLVFIAVLCTTLRRLESKSKRKEKPLSDALRWVCQGLLYSIQCPDPLTWSLSKNGSPPAFKPLSEVLTKCSEEAVRSVSTSYFQYPIEGFVVMTELVNELGYTHQLRKIAKKAVFQRLLFHVTEQFDKEVEAQGHVLVHLAMTRLLTLEQGRRDKTPGARQFSSFRGIAGLTRNLFGDRKLLRDRLSITFEELIAASLLDRNFLTAFKKLGPLADSLEAQSGHAIAIFVHYLYRYKTDSWKSPDEHYMDIAKTPALASVLLEPSEISAGKAERLIAKLPPWDTIGDTTDNS
jgi:hypothetical protein